MSYDVYIYGPAEPVECFHCGVTSPQQPQLFSRNHTSNTSGMWRKAGVDLAEIKGKRAGDLIEPLRTAIAHMVDNPDEYTPMNPENGWGSYESTIKFLRAILAACEEFPEGEMGVWA